ncbi:MAG: hypothetical protein OER86_12395, partial [Phycisphaerae bacterium]|nr:hypothetical protein [Phycisphaerae bacterium]
AVRLAAAIRISIFGRLEARVAAVPILVKHASGKSSLEGWNAYVGLHRCVRVFASGLTDKTRAQHALGGFRQFDRAYLKQYLRESQEKFKGLERGDLRPLLKTAAKQGAEPEHRAFAALALSWLSAP